MALFSREDHFCHLFLVNVLFLHKPVLILLVGLFLNILPNWNILFNFKALLLFRYFAEYFYLLTKEGLFENVFMKTFKYYSCFKAKLNYSMIDSNWKNK